MAKTATALFALDQPTPSAYAARVEDAIGDIDCTFLAMEALESLVAPQKAGSGEDLVHVSRDGLGMLLGILNINLREQIEHAKERASAASAALVI
jgi:hypothetical protein